ncbi:MAG: hypothetical protein M1814_006078 [Vezdaea aestivalis]|nr:MAG: hypothetical protein M1814_006078 [Vezdaea aestivalis]
MTTPDTYPFLRLNSYTFNLPPLQLQPPPPLVPLPPIDPSSPPDARSALSHPQPTPPSPPLQASLPPLQADLFTAYTLGSDWTSTSLPHPNQRAPRPRPPKLSQPLHHHRKHPPVHLPQVPKKQAPRPRPPPAVLPVISDLKTPPSTASLFPRITPSAFEDAHGRNALNGVGGEKDGWKVLGEEGKAGRIAAAVRKEGEKGKGRKQEGPEQDKAAPPKGGTNVPAPQASVSAQRKDKAEPPSPSKRGRKSNPTTSAPVLQSSSTKKPRNKWTDAETDLLLRGVSKHGSGNWKAILSDTSFPFPNRSTIDLKDRFRTICPLELKPPPSSSSTSTAFRKRKTHQRTLSSLSTLGIDRPFPTQARRARHPFSATEDASLMQGFRRHGTAWARIASDPALGLGNRRATDLRDRFRNRFGAEYERAGFAIGAGKGKKEAEGEPNEPVVPPVDSSTSSAPTTVPISAPIPSIFPPPLITQDFSLPLPPLIPTTDQQPLSLPHDLPSLPFLQTPTLLQPQDQDPTADLPAMALPALGADLPLPAARDLLEWGVILGVGGSAVGNGPVEERRKRDGGKMTREKEGRRDHMSVSTLVWDEFDFEMIRN